MEKFKNKKSRSACRQAGMTYVELIVVLAIFSIMSGVVLFNYQDFNKKLEIKSLANDIALKVTEAQKSAMSGQLAPAKQQVVQGESDIVNWKPAYGLYFSTGVKNKFIYFADLDNSVLQEKPAYNINAPVCNKTNAGGLDFLECINEIILKKDYNIDTLKIFCTGSEEAIDAGGNISIAFTRPDSRAYIQTGTPEKDCQISHAIIGVTSSSEVSAEVTVYSSGRIQIN
jgi:prepilin-type N-terminal cleavage/methylation domain-containing protein